MCKYLESSSVDVNKISEFPQGGEHDRVSHIFHSDSAATDLAPVALVEDSKFVRVLIVLNTIHPFAHIQVVFFIIYSAFEELVVHLLS